MEIVFIRHAQPEWVREGVSVLDPELTARGAEQAALLAGAPALHRRPPTALLVSPTRRAQATAAPLAKALGVSPRTAPWLEEMRLPAAWDQTPAHTIADYFFGAPARSFEQWMAGAPGGESFDAFHDRVTTNLAAALAALGVHRAADTGAHPGVFRVEAPDQRVVIVAHAGTNAVALTWLLALDQVPWAWERFVATHASITRVKSTALMGGAIFGLREHSDASHLPREMRTR